jgi:hypothetical protein
MVDANHSLWFVLAPVIQLHFVPIVGSFNHVFCVSQEAVLATPSLFVGEISERQVFFGADGCPCHSITSVNE